MKNKFANKLKDAKIQSIIQNSLVEDLNNCAKRCKFNFHYMDFSQNYGSSFETCSNLTKLMNKLKVFSEKSLAEWQITPLGKSHILDVYGPNIPRGSKYIKPAYIPSGVHWARFHIEGDFRLIGFIIPNEHCDKEYQSGYRFDKNTFYCVFIDECHNFYPVKKRHS